MVGAGNHKELLMADSLVTSQPVCVTGATGFVASQLIQDLLDAGYRVRGTVRDLAKKDSYQHLTSLPGAAERLALVAADLMDDKSFDAAVQGCEYVMHTASPYVLDAKDPQKDLVDPAVNGTRHVLRACARAGTVKRVVLTSSMAAITDEPDESHVLTEADWNEKSSLERNPYYYSKTMAEREGWRFIEEEKPGFDLVVINPFIVIGPSLGPSLNTSNQIFVDLMQGVYPGIMNIAWGMVDVREVSRAHILAMEKTTASGRYLCSNSTITMRALVELLASLGYGDYKLPKLGLDCKIGDFAVRLSSYMQPKGVGSYLRTHVGRKPVFDNSKIQKDLGLSFRPLEDSIRDTLEDLKKWGHLKPAKS